MDSVSPVFTEAEVSSEVVIALDQPQFIPIVTLPLHVQMGEAILMDYMRAVRFRLNDEERAMIAGGADLVITEVTCSEPFTPINIQICKPGEKAQFVETA